MGTTAQSPIKSPPTEDVSSTRRVFRRTEVDSSTAVMAKPTIAARRAPATRRPVSTNFAQTPAPISSQVKPMQPVAESRVPLSKETSAEKLSSNGLIQGSRVKYLSARLERKAVADAIEPRPPVKQSAPPTSPTVSPKPRGTVNRPASIAPNASPIRRVESKEQVYPRSPIRADSSASGLSSPIRRTDLTGSASSRALQAQSRSPRQGPAVGNKPLESKPAVSDSRKARDALLGIPRQPLERKMRSQTLQRSSSSTTEGLRPTIPARRGLMRSQSSGGELKTIMDEILEPDGSSRPQPIVRTRPVLGAKSTSRF